VPDFFGHSLIADAILPCAETHLGCPNLIHRLLNRDGVATCQQTGDVGCANSIEAAKDPLIGLAKPLNECQVECDGLFASIDNLSGGVFQLAVVCGADKVGAPAGHLMWELIESFASIFVSQSELLHAAQEALTSATNVRLNPVTPGQGMEFEDIGVLEELMDKGCLLTSVETEKRMVWCCLNATNGLQLMAKMVFEGLK
jgi:hypothetical protein